MRTGQPTERNRTYRATRPTRVGLFTGPSAGRNPHPREILATDVRFAGLGLTDRVPVVRAAQLTGGPVNSTHRNRVVESRWPTCRTCGTELPRNRNRGCDYCD